MRGILNEYADYIVSFVNAVGILVFLAVMMNMLATSAATFADTLC